MPFLYRPHDEQREQSGFQREWEEGTVYGLQHWIRSEILLWLGEFHSSILKEVVESFTKVWDV